MLRKAVGSISILALCFLVLPLAADAQQPAKVYRIGWLGLSTVGYETTPQHCPVKGNRSWQVWVEGLREHGYVQGQNLVIECRYTEGRTERSPALAAELVSLKPDLLIANGGANARAAKQVTSAIPIVMVNVRDPVGQGLVASLAHPGGNVTGMADVFLEFEGKRLQLLKEAVPKASRVAVLRYSGGSLPPSDYVRRLETAAQALGVTLQSYAVRAPEEITGAFNAMTRARAEALFAEASPFVYTHRLRIVDLAAQNRLSGMYHHRDFVEAGGLLSYEVNEPDIFRRLSSFADKVFKGAKPGELPVEQPTKFDLIINLKTAKALGLTIPPSLLAQADEVIQ